MACQIYEVFSIEEITETWKFVFLSEAKQLSCNKNVWIAVDDGFQMVFIM